MKFNSLKVSQNLNFILYLIEGFTRDFVAKALIDAIFYEASLNFAFIIE